MTPTYTKLAEDLTPTDTDHQIVRIEHPLLAYPLLVTARFAPETMTFGEAKTWAEGLNLGGFSWRLPTVEEAFFIPDRSNYPSFDSEIFVGAKEQWSWIWTSTLDAESPSGYAWNVLLGVGSCGRFNQVLRNLVLAVRAGQ